MRYQANPAEDGAHDLSVTLALQVPGSIAAVLLDWSNGARDKVHPEFRQGQCVSVPVERKGRSEAESRPHVSFIEQIGGARIGPSRRLGAMVYFSARCNFCAAPPDGSMLSRAPISGATPVTEKLNSCSTHSCCFEECSRRCQRRLSFEFSGRRRRSAGTKGSAPFHACRERRVTYWRNTPSIRDCHPSPVALKYAKTSGL